MPARPESVSLPADAQKRLAAELFNHVWTLLEKPDRTEHDNQRMIDAAHASRFFWEPVGGPVHWARGEWQISRVYATAGRPERALEHADRCLRICQENDIGGFDLAYAYEALARAHSLMGESGITDRYLQLARATAAQVEDAEDRELVLSDLATIGPPPA